MRRCFPRPSIKLVCGLAAALLSHGFTAEADPPSEISIPVKVQLPDDGELAGLPPGSHPNVLTWERAYTLALVQCRKTRPADKLTRNHQLDPKVLAEQARQWGIADFDRFRHDFCAEPRGVKNDQQIFADPSESLFDLQRRLHVIDNAWKFLRGLEELKAAYLEMIKAPQNPPRLNHIDPWIDKANRRYRDELQAYRNRLDEVKGALGIAPHAPVVPDRTSLAKFRVVFNAASEWAADPRRSLTQLPLLVARLPNIENVSFGQIAWEDVAKRDSSRQEDLFRAAERIAIQNREQGDLNGKRKEQIRRRMSRLLDLRTAYQREKQQWRLAIQTKDQVFNQLMESLGPGQPVPKVPDLIALQQELFESENKLVALWCSFHAERLSLARDLRLLPGRDWKSFLAQIEGEPSAAPTSTPRSR